LLSKDSSSPLVMTIAAMEGEGSSLKGNVGDLSLSTI